MEVADRLVSHFLRIPEDGVCFLVCFPDDAVPLLIQFCLPFRCLLSELFRFPAVCGDLLAFFLYGLFTCLKIRQKILEGNVLLAQPFPCVLDNVIGEPQLPEMANALLLPGIPMRRR